VQAQQRASGCAGLPPPLPPLLTPVRDVVHEGRDPGRPRGRGTSTVAGSVGCPGARVPRSPLRAVLRGRGAWGGGVRRTGGAAGARPAQQRACARAHLVQPRGLAYGQEVRVLCGVALERLG